MFSQILTIAFLEMSIDMHDLSSVQPYARLTREIQNVPREKHRAKKVPFSALSPRSAPENHK